MTKPLCGLYAIVNLVNGHFYVGSSINIYHRFSTHRSTLRSGTHRNAHLQHSWNKHSPDAFEFRVLLVCDPEKLHALEGVAIEGMRPTYNLTRYVSGSIVASEETRAKRSAIFKGRTVGPEHRARLSVALKGNQNGLGSKRTPEARAKMSEAQMGNTKTRGSKRSPETNAKQSASMKLIWAKRRSK